MGIARSEVFFLVQHDANLAGAFFEGKSKRIRSSRDRVVVSNHGKCIAMRTPDQK